MRKSRPENVVIEDVLVENYAAEGKALAKVDGKVIFIPFAAKGDVVDVKLLRSKKSFAEGEILTLKQKSPHRVEPVCSHFGTCGGCKWQHLDYAVQLEVKRQTVCDALVHIGGLDASVVSEIVPSDTTLNYRNKLEFTFTASRWLTIEEIKSDAPLDRNALGFHIPGRFDKVFDVNKCHLQHDLSNQIRDFVKFFAKANEISFYDMNKTQGVLRNLILRNSNLGEWMVIVQVFDFDESKVALLMNALKSEFPQISSLYLVVNQKGNETFNDLPLKLWHGKAYLTEKMDNLEFRIGPKTFYQTNAAQAKKLYTLAKEMANIQKTDVVYDLYTGAGTIANFVADKAAKVIGVEYVEQAIEDAKVNSQINNITNTYFFAGDMKKVLNQDFIAQNGKPDIIITDPPRAGMDKEVIEKIIEMQPKRVVYVSCNPATQARDLQLLASKYRVLKVTPVDMFPQTHHCESVALLEMRGENI